MSLESRPPRRWPMVVAVLAIVGGCTICGVGAIAWRSFHAYLDRARAAELERARAAETPPPAQ